MPYYVFAIGGTGARCLDALIYLCAMGLGPDQAIHPIIVDPDKGNGNGDSTIELLSLYKQIRASIKNPKDGYFFKTEILYDDSQDSMDTKKQIPNFFDPNVGMEAGQNTLSHFIEYNTKLKMTENHYLAELLFSEDERNMSMDQGYRGVPSIGSVLMTKVQKQQFWAVIKDSLENDINSKAFIFASVFGGTGASGYPVISRLLKNSAPSTKTGGALMLPYFKLPNAKNLLKQQPELKKERILPNSDSFLINAKTACQFYAKAFDSNDSNYVLGDDYDLCNPYENYAIGSKKQKNNAHFIELYAALASIDFESKSDNSYQKYYVLRVHNSGKEGEAATIEARDLPDNKKLLEKFEKLSLLYHFIEDLYKSIEEQDVGLLDKIAWLRKISIKRGPVRGKDLIEIKEQINKLKTFLNRYKTWMNQMHTNTPELKIQNSNLNLDSLLVDDTKKYQGFDITKLDLQFYKQNTDQQNLLGAMLEMMSKAAMIKGVK